MLFVEERGFIIYPLPERTKIKQIIEINYKELYGINVQLYLDDDET